MQIFITSKLIYETCEVLDSKRFHRQISEAKIIKNAILGKNKWTGPIVEMYRRNFQFLELYIQIFENFRSKNIDVAKKLSEQAKTVLPVFVTDFYIENMKKRLYTKNKIHYQQWKYLGESYVNLYYVDNQWIRKVQGVVSCSDESSNESSNMISEFCKSS